MSNGYTINTIADYFRYRGKLVKKTMAQSTVAINPRLYGQTEFNQDNYDALKAEMLAKTGLEIQEILETDDEEVEAEKMVSILNNQYYEKYKTTFSFSNSHSPEEQIDILVDLDEALQAWQDLGLKLNQPANVYINLNKKGNSCALDNNITILNTEAGAEGLKKTLCHELGHVWDNQYAVLNAIESGSMSFVWYSSVCPSKTSNIRLNELKALLRSNKLTKKETKALILEINAFKYNESLRGYHNWNDTTIPTILNERLTLIKELNEYANMTPFYSYSKPEDKHANATMNEKFAEIVEFASMPIESDLNCKLTSNDFFVADIEQYLPAQIVKLKMEFQTAKTPAESKAIDSQLKETIAKYESLVVKKDALLKQWVPAPMETKKYVHGLLKDALKRYAEHVQSNFWVEQSFLKKHK